MIKGTFGIITVLLLIEGIILYLSEKKFMKKFFYFLPSMFWIYFLPMLASTFNILPQNSLVYQGISTYFLPASLILLLISTDLSAIVKLGRPALIMMFSGSLGIILGGPIVLFLFKRWLPENAWCGLGALSASWIGGSANMLAVKEGIGTPDKIFLPMVVVDTIVPYVWMGILIWLAVYQNFYDRWNKSDTNVIEELSRKISEKPSLQHPRLNFNNIMLIFTAGFLGTVISWKVAPMIPEIKNAISTYTWTIIIASIIGILLSFTKAKRLESCGASKIGYVVLYFVLSSIGARANLNAIISAPLFIFVGFLWVLIHALFLFVASRLIKAPMFLIAAASQANIGGPASAPVVAAVYQPALASVGLMLAILGNVMGTYLGIVCSQLCRWVSRI